jgi:peptidoglycan/LPS O-acetylase OafA/YrhL
MGEHRSVASTRPAARGQDDAAARLPGLDGLRGVAAFVVVIHHALLTWPVLAAQYFAPNPSTGTWWLTFTPLHLAWAGTEAVFLFFILSGLVLVGPYLSPRRRGSWSGYYARRLLRLYPPVAASLVLAAVLVHAFPRTPTPSVSWWFASHDVDVTLPALGHDVVLLAGTGWINGPLWSLRHEVLFSLLLPAVVLVARRLPPRLVLTLPATLALISLAQTSSSDVVRWMPVFLVGVVLATGRSDLRALAACIEAGRRPALGWWAVAAAAITLLLSEWWARGLQVPVNVWAVAAPPLICLGGAMTCFLVMECGPVAGIFGGGVLQWLGRISFSLYLVHEPVVVSVAGLAGPGTAGVVTTLAVGGGLSVALAVAFHRLVEAPCQRWARRVGSAVDARRRRPPALPAPEVGPVTMALPMSRRLPPVPESRPLSRAGADR